MPVVDRKQGIVTKLASMNCSKTHKQKHQPLHEQLKFTTYQFKQASITEAYASKALPIASYIAPHLFRLRSS